MNIKIICNDKRKEAVELVHKVFMACEAPDYSEEGVKTFHDTAIYNNEYLDNLIIYGAFDGEALRGVIATRNNGSHIALFFVDTDYHKKGIGSLLFKTVVENCRTEKITVNSSPFAVEVYRHLGFTPTAEEQIECGMRFVPMVFIE